MAAEERPHRSSGLSGRRALKRGAGPQRTAPLKRSGKLKRGGPPRRRTRLARGGPLDGTPFAPASPAQRAKVVGARCLVCAGKPVDPAHLVARPQGGCDEPACIIPLCRACHRAYDDGGLDLLPWLEPGHRSELAHALLHAGLVGVLRRVTGRRG